MNSPIGSAWAVWISIGKCASARVLGTYLKQSRLDNNFLMQLPMAVTAIDQLGFSCCHPPFDSDKHVVIGAKAASIELSWLWEPVCSLEL